ncbi:c-type cytochrome [Azospirillum sp. sgz301742]
MRTALAFSLALALLAACDQRMVEQPNRRAFETAARLPDRRVNQPPPPGTVARDELEAARTLATRPPMSAALLARGRERFEINCAPCHARTGEGDGMIVQRGFPRPPSYFEQRLVDAPDSHFLDVMSNGYGAMYSYADRVAPADRWAILAYIRALQLSRHVAAADLPDDLRRKLGDRP